MSSVTIRPYRDSDKAALRRCLIELQEFERNLDDRMQPGEKIADRYVPELLTEADKPYSTLLVAELDDAVVGYVAVNAKVSNDEPDERDYEYAYISDVVVRESARDSGIGKALLAEAEKFALQHGAHWLRIGVLGLNDGAHRLYQSLGFKSREIVLEKNLCD